MLKTHSKCTSHVYFQPSSLFVKQLLSVVTVFSIFDVWYEFLGLSGGILLSVIFLFLQLDIKQIFGQSVMLLVFIFSALVSHGLQIVHVARQFAH